MMIKSKIPSNCGYMKKFKYNVDMHTNGISGLCIEWCENNCKKKWGWWFEDDGTLNPPNHWEHQRAYMSFESKQEAMAFWLAEGIANQGASRGN